MREDWIIAAEDEMPDSEPPPDVVNDGSESAGEWIEAAFAMIEPLTCS
jgi:hypothetical protein